MKIRLAKTAGFCMGVRRAVEMVLDIQRQSVPTPIVTYGPLIHNPQTLKLLQSKGIGQVTDLSEVQGGTVIIRAHGISPQERKELQERADLVVDATCPRVARVQAIIAKHARAGDFCIIVGDQDHPEVRGLVGFAAAGAVVIPDATSALRAMDEIPDNRRICLVAQTTQEPEKFEAISRMIKDRFRDVRNYNTICNSTRKRQHEVAQLAETVDLVIVVGGRGSGNTTRLVKVAESKGKKTLHVETEEELSAQHLEGIDAVGVTAGASTPNWLILSVIDKIKEIDLQRKKGLFPLARKVIDAAIMTYVWAALAGGALSAACMALQNMSLSALPVAVSCLFVFSMHLFNRIHDASGAVRFNTPQIAAFYARYRTLLTILAASSSVFALTLSSFMGIYPFLLLLLMISAGGIYTAQLLPPSLFPSLKWRSLKDFPGSKTPLVAAGWAMAAAVL
ncbi:MAG: 4-hydroxy-3-methylbut-2-enyl diphosphate reductase, partial [Desulfomonilaceae bacterium]